eukprot:CAMPEP_0167749664 /NCGR_PEP_ID=MMETSP0110_2-20121227/5541_1 /TAXON_ID=629695 /ORGANISM="Gymnochlora sp., Strain CCMP2014" /LENGTH=397 /DNA_ID=CAMNT_0007634859 /DNA_START=255 /DNA_END=1448 /DNA_ORIENTATION=+
MAARSIHSISPSKFQLTDNKKRRKISASTPTKSNGKVEVKSSVGKKIDGLQVHSSLFLRGEDFWEIPTDFSLAQAICSYGYFALAPNKWTPASNEEDEDRGVFTRAFRLGAEGVVWASIRQLGSRKSRQDPPKLRVALDRELTKEEQQSVMDGIARMLRIDFDLTDFHEKYPEASERGFGRTFRSPNLWEDMVKTITNCNMKWSGTVRMSRLLCERVGKEGGFPTPEEVSKFSAEWLKTECKLGYRAERIRRLAFSFITTEEEKRIDVEWLEDEKRTSKEVFKKVLGIYGFGPFAAYNVCQLLGHFESFPYDSETVRHFKEEHNAPSKCKLDVVKKMAEKHYATFAPYQFLAYWFELWKGYERRRGSESVRWVVRGNQTESSDLFDVTKKNRKRGRC